MEVPSKSAGKVDFGAIESPIIKDVDVTKTDADFANLLQSLDLNDYKSPDCLDKLFEQGFSHLKDFKSNGNLTDLDISIKFFRQWFWIAHDENPMRPWLMCVLSDALGRRFRTLHIRADLEEALALGQHALALKHLSPLNIVTYVSTVAQRQKQMWQNFHQMQRLDPFVRACREAVEIRDEQGCPDISYTADYCWALSERYKQRGDQADVLEERKVAKSSQDELPTDPADRSVALQIYARSMARCSIHVEGSLVEVDQSLQLLSQSLAFADQSKHAGILDDLAFAYSARYKVTGDASNLEKAIESLQEMLTVAEKESAEYWRGLHNMAEFYYSLYEATGNSTKLDEAIDLFRQAKDLKSLTNEEVCLELNQLAMTLRTRYTLSRSFVDIEESMQLNTQVTKQSEEGNVQHIVALESLAFGFGLRFDRFKRLLDCDQGIKILQELLQTVSSDLRRSKCLMDLSGQYSARYRAIGNDEDIEKGLSYAKQALSLASKNDKIEYAKFLYSLAQRHYDRYSSDIAERVVDLTKSCELLQQCQDSVPQHHVDWAFYTDALIERSTFILARHAKSESESEAGLYRLIEWTRLLYWNEAATPATKIGAARLHLTFTVGLKQMKHRQQGAEIAKDVVRTLSLFTPTVVGRQDLQKASEAFVGLSSLVAVSLIAAGEAPSEAFRHLEISRTSMIGLTLKARTDVDKVRDLDAKLYDSYRLARLEFSTSTVPTEGDAYKFRRAQMRKIAGLEQEIRQLPGMGTFQTPLTIEQLRGMACEGPLVCFISVGKLSAALVVTTEKISEVFLPQLHEDKLKEQVSLITGAKRLTKCSLMQRSQNNTKLRKLLAWLWDVVVKPVLDHLGFEGKTERLPRLWWITNGHMGLMPLHAAGKDWDRSTENTASRVISSYVSSTEMLRHARERRQKAMAEVSKRLLAIEMPHTPEEGWNDLKTAGEMKALQESAQAHDFPVEIMSSPSAEAAIQGMGSASHVHIACHGDPHMTDPSKTSLVLCKDGRADRMTVSQLFDQVQDHAQLAYLSACCTAQQYSERLIDESIHLGTVFQLMGFPSVIATLWEADDSAGAAVASGFYRRLLSEGQSCVATCLHEALSEYRKTKSGRRTMGENVICWAPFIHIGA